MSSKRTWVVMVVALCGVFLWGRISGQAEARAGVDVLLKADTAYGADTAARGLAGWMAWLAPDAAIFPPGHDAVRGKDAIAAYYGETGFDPKPLRWIPQGGDLAKGADLGWTWGTWSMDIPQEDGTVRTATGKYLSVWKKQKDGSWKVAADIGNSNPPAR